MSKKCEGGCNRTWNKYYFLNNGQIFCYDCWLREKNHTMEQRRYSQEMQRLLFNINNDIFVLKIEIKEKDYHNDDEVKNLKKQMWRLQDQKDRENSRLLSFFTDSSIFENPTWCENDNDLFEAQRKKEIKDREKKLRKKKESTTTAKGGGLNVASKRDLPVVRGPRLAARRLPDTLHTDVSFPHPSRPS